MSRWDVQLVADTQCEVGEGPLWHPDRERLYWTDILGGTLHRYDPSTDAHEEIYRGEMVGGFTIQADGSLLLFGEGGSVRVWDGDVIKTVIDRIPGEEGCRFNDVIAGPEGRVFAGTMAMPGEERMGRVYRLETDGTYTKIIEDIEVPNGFGFTPDRRGIYFTDTQAGAIKLFDYDPSTGELSSERIFVEIPEEEGLPDGMTVDEEGYVWSARWNGRAVYRYDPDGVEVNRIPLPPRKVSCVTFGNPDYQHLYVTTACLGSPEEEGEVAGGLFRLNNPGVNGVEEFRSRIDL